MIEFLSQHKDLLPAIITGSVTLVAAVAAFGIGLMNYLHNKRQSSYNLHREITESHNKLAEFQRTHPEVFRVGREWTADCMHRVYSHCEKDGNQIYVFYYCYVEQCVNYCNLVLSHRRDIKKSSYLRHHRDNLVKQILTENFPIINNYLKEKKYLSPFVQEFVEELKVKGLWRWEEEHEKIVWPDGKPE
jgi:hypothetical protein